jgi:pyrroline-5-carboxylate reductase
MAIDLDGSLLLAGAGNMGSALLAGWIKRGMDPKRIVVQDPGPPPSTQELARRHGIDVRAAIASGAATPAVLVLAVKPQVMEAVLPPLAKLAGPETVVLSIAAGRTIASLQRHLATGIAVVRAMPNTPAAIGRGITVATASAGTSPKQRETCDALLGAVGEVAWVEEERLLDAVTAVSGSGPAYVFYLAECLAEAGVAAGLNAGLARQLARATVAGAGELLYRSELDATELRRNVTSQGGTTAAALEVLMGSGGLAPLLGKAVSAATKRAGELAS